MARMVMNRSWRLVKLPSVKSPQPHIVTSNFGPVSVQRFDCRYKASFAQSLIIDHEEDQQHIVKSPFPDVDLPTGVSIPEYVQANMGPWADSIAYECAVRHVKYTFKQVFQIAKSFGASLIQAGFKPGDVIAIVLENGPEFAPVLFGIWHAGLVASPANPNYTADEIGRQLSIAGAKGVVTSSKFIPVIKEAQGKRNASSPSFIVNIGEPQDGCHSFFEMIKTDTKSVTFPRLTDRSSVEDTALLPFSSGTTGLPKGVCLTHYSLLSNLIQCTYPGLQTRPRLGPVRERLIGVLPFFHSYGLAVFMGSTFFNGAHTLCLPKFERALFLHSIKYHKPTSLHLVPPLIALINNSDDYGKEELESLEYIMVGAAPVGRSVIDAFIKKIAKPFTFLEGYGMTELSPVTHIHPPFVNHRLGSCGVPVPNTLTKIIDADTGKTVGKNQRGELLVKGPQMMTGYFNNAEATRNTIDSNGWLHTGDIAYYDDNGYCFIVDRIKELIKVKGFQVAPSELEDLIRNHKNVSDVAVIGVPNEEMGEAPRAYIVRNSDTVTEDSINAYLKPLISSYKQLKGGIEFLDEIPKAASGKLLRRELSVRYKEAKGIRTN